MLKPGEGLQERTLIIQAQEGDIEAYNELVRMYRVSVVNIVYRMCGDANLAEDSAQIAFLRAWENLPRLVPGSSFCNWLYRIAVNVAVDIVRHEKQVISLDDEHIPVRSELPELEIIANERHRKVRKAVTALPAASRSVLVLREYQELSYREIAEVLGIPIGTVMSRLSYARKLLADQLQEFLEAA
jgi:RNA polymerase sigma-70 factor (ECF subfamily)